MLNQLKATPRPWKILDGSKTGIVGLHGKNMWFICRTEPDEEGELNASLIVKAVNNHEALFEACRSAKLAMETSGLASGYGAKVYDRICQAINQAQ